MKSTNNGVNKGTTSGYVLLDTAVVLLLNKTDIILYGNHIGHQYT